MNRPVKRERWASVPLNSCVASYFKTLLIISLLLQTKIVIAYCATMDSQA